MCLVLHACGHATDVAMLQAHRCRAAMIVSPCCVGKLVFSPTLELARSNHTSGLDGVLPEDPGVNHTTTTHEIHAWDDLMGTMALEVPEISPRTRFPGFLGFRCRCNRVRNSLSFHFCLPYASRVVYPCGT